MTTANCVSGGRWLLQIRTAGVYVRCIVTPCIGQAVQNDEMLGVGTSSGSKPATQTSIEEHFAP